MLDSVGYKVAAQHASRESSQKTNQKYPSPRNTRQKPENLWRRRIWCAASIISSSIVATRHTIFDTGTGNPWLHPVTTRRRKKEGPRGDRLAGAGLAPSSLSRVASRGGTSRRQTRGRSSGYEEGRVSDCLGEEERGQAAGSVCDCLGEEEGGEVGMLQSRHVGLE